MTLDIYEKCEYGKKHPHSLDAARRSCDIRWPFPESRLKFICEVVPSLRVVQGGSQACVQVFEVGMDRDGLLRGHWSLLTRSQNRNWQLILQDIVTYSHH